MSPKQSDFLILVPTQYIPPFYPFLTVNMGMCSFVFLGLLREGLLTGVLGLWVAARALQGLGCHVQRPWVCSVPHTAHSLLRAFILVWTCGDFSTLAVFQRDSRDSSAARGAALSIRMKTKVSQPGDRCFSDPYDLHSPCTNWMISLADETLSLSLSSSLYV